MSTDTAAQVFAGITNENEFYGHHYLAEVFKGDIRDRLNAWQAREDEAKEAAKASTDAADTSWRSPQRVLAGAGGRAVGGFFRAGRPNRDDRPSKSATGTEVAFC